MAKIGANGAHEVARVQRDDEVQYLLRSDGKVLRRFKIQGTWEGWSIFGTFRLRTADATESSWATRFKRAMQRFGAEEA